MVVSRRRVINGADCAQWPRLDSRAELHLATTNFAIIYLFANSKVALEFGRFKGFYL